MAKKKRRINRKKQIRNILILILIPVLVIVLLVSNLTRIRLWIKGYSFTNQNILLQVENVDEYVSLDHVVDVDAWDVIENKHNYIEYELYSKQLKASKEETVEYVDQFNDLKDNLLKLGYPMDAIRTYMLRYSIADFEELIDQQQKYEDVKEYLDIKGCQVKDLTDYQKSDEFGKRAILAVSYPFIDSHNEPLREYEIKEPANALALIKKGFFVPADYEPSDLVSTNLEAADVTVSNHLRKKAAEALDQMAADAAKEGYELVVNSAYRSYEDQQAIYDEYFQIYDPATAASLVAIPGCSEHQLGLSVDLISKSVLNGTYGVFGDSPDYQWTVMHAHEYGFVLRYPEDKTAITGTANEPWHYRYVGKKAAKEMFEEHLTLEEYILKHGFTYDLILE